MGIIRIIGVGRGGIRAVEAMHRNGIIDVSYAIYETDEVILNKSSVNFKIHSKDKKSLSEQSKNQLIEYTRGVRMLFVFAGMGGNLSAELLPEIIETINQQHVLTICMLTIPFAFEGADKIEKAKNSIEKIRCLANSVFELNSQLILEIFPETELSDTFTKLQSVQYDIVSKIMRSMPWYSYICTDFSDLFSMFKDSKHAVIGTGISAGENRITKAIDSACRFQYFDDNDVVSYNMFYLMIHCSSEHQLRMKEVAEIHSFIDGLSEKTSFVWTASFNDELGEEAEVVLIAGAYDQNDVKRELR